MVVLFDSARSALPPQNSGSCSAIAWIAASEALRVAMSLPAGNAGSFSSQPAGSSRRWIRSKSAARCGLAARQAS